MIRTLFASAVLLVGIVLAGDNRAPASKMPTASLISLDGKSTTLEAMKGKTATVVVFTSFECPVSNSYVAPLNEMVKAYAEKGVSIVAVCPTDDAADVVKKAAAGFKPAYPVLLDPKKELATALKATITPEAIVLGPNGDVLYRGRIDDRFASRNKPNAMVTSHDLKNAIEDVLTGKPVRTATTKAIGCGIDFTPAPQGGAVTYYKDVASILQTNCQHCHRPGEVGPFALTNYKQARRWADDIKSYTASKQMPPWMATGGLPMQGERKLTEKEIATLAAWVDGGCPEGDPKDAPPPLNYPDGWRNGKPDLIVSVGEDFNLAPTGNDLFRCFVIPTGLTQDRWIIGYDVKPGNPKIVHHTLHFFDTSGQGRELELKQKAKDEGQSPPDRGPGYTTGMGVGFVAKRPQKGEAPTFGGIGGWAPGQAPHFVPQGAGWLLPKGSDFIIQTHYHRDGQPGTDRTQVGLYFAKGPVEKPWQTMVVAGLQGWEKIPAGKADYRARGSLYLHTDCTLHNVLPHMHLLGKSVKVTMTPPNGAPVVLVDIAAWDYRWQETYWFKEPIHAKRGTKLEIEAIFDNSASNPNNPSKPPVDVKVGEDTTDEMLFGFFGATSTKVPSEKIKRFGFPPSELGATAAPAQGQMMPVLEKRLGNWDLTTTIKPILGKETKIVTNETVAKAYDGTFLRIDSGNEEEGTELVELVTYDPARKAYRMWTYNAQGTVIEWEGFWSEKDSTLLWNASFQGGYTGVMRWMFPSADKFDFHLTVKSGTSTVMTMTGAMNRKK